MSDVISPGGTSRGKCAVWSGDPEDRLRVSLREVCAICLEAFTSGEHIQPMVYCSHLFHKACVDDWLQSRGSDEGPHTGCPICRASMAARSLSEMPDKERTAVRHFKWPTVDILNESFSGSVGDSASSSLGGSRDVLGTRMQTTIIGEWPSDWLQS